jgi:hypothetical protein
MRPSVTKGKRLRERGLLAKLADSEVIIMEVVGTYLGLSQVRRCLMHTVCFFFNQQDAAPSLQFDRLVA